MEPVDRRLILAGAGLAGVAALSRIAKAGPLGPPPGPITSTGKTLQQIHDRVARGGDAATPEARLPVQGQPGSASAQYVISQPGAYYLAGNINQASGLVCIDIQCDGVDVDGGGFAFIGTSASPSTPASCIRAVGRRAIEIYDCLFKGWQGCCCDCDDCDDVYVSDCLFLGCSSPGDPATGQGGAMVRCRDRCEIDDVCVSLCSGCTLKTRHDSIVVDFEIADSTGDACSVGLRCCVCDGTVTNVTGAAVVCGQGSCVSECDCRNVNGGGGGGGGGVVSAGAGSVVECCEMTGCSGTGYACGDNCSVEDSTCVSHSGTAIACGQGSSVTECDCRGVSGGIGAVVTTGPNSVVECCEMSGCSGTGYFCGDACTVEDSTCVSHTGAAIACGHSSSVSECDCRGVSGGVGAVVNVGSGSVVECCECVDCDADFVQCGDGSCVEDCLFENGRYVLRSGSIGAASSVTVSDNRAVLCWGVNLGADCVCCGNELNTSQGPAILVGGPRCCVEDNHLTSVGPGGGCIDVLPGGDGTLIESNHIVVGGSAGVAIEISPGVTGCHVACNTARGGYNIPSLNSFGPVVNVAGVGNIGAIPEASHPWANFSH